MSKSSKSEALKSAIPREQRINFGWQPTSPGLRLRRVSAATARNCQQSLNPRFKQSPPIIKLELAYHKKDTLHLRPNIVSGRKNDPAL
jgi:hypothetical protein